MRFSSKSLLINFLIGLTVIVVGISQVLAVAVVKSDILLHIVSQCVDPSVKNYCANCILPRVDAGCDQIHECKKTNEIWALNKHYAAIRDIKMCGCPVEFIHGLVMPRDVVTGVEDPSRQEGIWQFAWDVGLERIQAESLALVVNPKSQRTQNQLHIHMLKLDQNARAHFMEYEPNYVDNLESVWLVADSSAKAKGLNDYGVLVANAQNSQYIVLVSPNSPEADFTIWNCN